MFDDILPEFGIKTKFENPLDPDDFEKVINEHTQMLFAEVIGNPVLDVANIKAISEIAT